MKTDLLIIPMSARYRDMRAAALAAEAAGFDGLWTWDHLRDPDAESGPGVPEAWTVLTALAEVARGPGWGTLRAVSGGRGRSRGAAGRPRLPEASPPCWPGRRDGGDAS